MGTFWPGSWKWWEFKAVERRFYRHAVVALGCGVVVVAGLKFSRNVPAACEDAVSDGIGVQCLIRLNVQYLTDNLTVEILQALMTCFLE